LVNRLRSGIVALAATRRAGTTTPALSSARTGVSKKCTSRICASSGSSPSAAIADRCPPSSTVALKLHAVGLPDQAEQLDQLGIGQVRRDRAHAATLSRDRVSTRRSGRVRP
jgi:hypothetical protein